ncbi:hypothetical protein DV735_g5465, partial [Chaetothyriales sp. CBS 134920]
METVSDQATPESMSRPSPGLSEVSDSSSCIGSETTTSSSSSGSTDLPASAYDGSHLHWKAFRQHILAPHRIRIIEGPPRERLPETLLAFIEAQSRNIERFDDQKSAFRIQVSEGRGFGPSPLFPPNLLPSIETEPRLARCMIPTFSREALPDRTHSQGAPDYELGVPRPGLGCGFGSFALSNEEIAILPHWLVVLGTSVDFDTGFISPKSAIYCPYLTFERTYGAKEHRMEAANNRCAIDGAWCCRALQLFHEKAYPAASSRSTWAPVSFSCTIDNETAIINYHWIDRGQSYHMSPLCRFELSRDDHFSHFVAWVDAINEWALTSLLPQIRDCIDQLRKQDPSLRSPAPLSKSPDKLTLNTVENKNDLLIKSLKTTFDNIPWRFEDDEFTPVSSSTASWGSPLVDDIILASLTYPSSQLPPKLMIQTNADGAPPTPRPSLADKRMSVSTVPPKVNLESGQSLPPPAYTTNPELVWQRRFDHAMDEIRDLQAQLQALRQGLTGSSTSFRRELSGLRNTLGSVLRKESVMSRNRLLSPVPQNFVSQVNCEGLIQSIQAPPARSLRVEPPPRLKLQTSAKAPRSKLHKVTLPSTSPTVTLSMNGVDLVLSPKEISTTLEVPGPPHTALPPSPVQKSPLKHFWGPDTPLEIKSAPLTPGPSASSDKQGPFSIDLSRKTLSPYAWAGAMICGWALGTYAPANIARIVILTCAATTSCLAAALLGLVFGFRVRSEPGIFEDTHGGTAQNSPSYVLVNFSATRLVFAASFLSTVAPLLASFVMSLWSLIVSAQMKDSSTHHSFEDLPTPYQLSILVGLCLASMEQLCTYVRYSAGRKRSQELPPVLNKTAGILIITCLLALAVFLSDVTLHYLTSTVVFDQITSVPAPQLEYGYGLSSLCLDLDRVTENAGFPCSVPLGPEEVPFVDENRIAKRNEMQRLQSNISSVSQLRVTNSSSTGSGLAIMIPNPARLSTETDFRASTIGVSTQCQLVPPTVCNMTPIAESEDDLDKINTQFNCSDNFFGVLGLWPNISSADGTKAIDPNLSPLAFKPAVNLQYAFFTSENLSTLYNPESWDPSVNQPDQLHIIPDGELLNPFYLGVAMRVGINTFTENSTITLSEPNVMVNDYSVYLDLIMECSVASYEVNYTWFRSTIQNVTAVPSRNGSLLEIFHGGQTYNTVSGASDLQQYMIDAAIAGDDTESFTSTWSNRFSVKVLSLVGAYLTPRTNLQEQNRKSLLVAKVPKLALAALVACSLSYTLLGISLVIAAWKATTHNVRQIAEQLSLAGLTQMAFGEGKQGTAAVAASQSSVSTPRCSSKTRARSQSPSSPSDLSLPRIPRREARKGSKMRTKSSFSLSLPSVVLLVAIITNAVIPGAVMVMAEDTPPRQRPVLHSPPMLGRLSSLFDLISASPSGGSDSSPSPPPSPLPSLSICCGASCCPGCCDDFRVVHTDLAYAYPAPTAPPAWAGLRPLPLNTKRPCCTPGCADGACRVPQETRSQRPHVTPSPPLPPGRTPSKSAKPTNTLNIIIGCCRKCKNCDQLVSTVPDASFMAAVAASATTATVADAAARAAVMDRDDDNDAIDWKAPLGPGKTPVLKYVSFLPHPSGTPGDEDPGAFVEDGVTVMSSSSPSSSATSSNADPEPTYYIGDEINDAINGQNQDILPIIVQS